MTSTVPFALSMRPGTLEATWARQSLVIHTAGSRDSDRVSQDRDGCPQIQSLGTDKGPMYLIISEMLMRPWHLLSDGSASTLGYRLGYRACYSVVYAQASEAM